MSFKITIQNLIDVAGYSSTQKQQMLDSIQSPSVYGFKFAEKPNPLQLASHGIQSLLEQKLTPEKMQNPYLEQSFSNKLFTDPEILFLNNFKTLGQLFFAADAGLLNPSLSVDEVRCAFERLEEPVRNILAGKIYELSKDPFKGGLGWGERHAFDDMAILKEAVFQLVPPSALIACKEKIDHFAKTQLEGLSQEEKNQIYGTFYHLSGRPQTSDAQWAEHNILGNPSLLIGALHCHGKIEKIGALRAAQCAKDWEIGKCGEFSTYYSVEGRTLSKGEIGFINGMGCSFQNARADAKRISENYCQGYAMHCVYAATVGDWDITSGILSQKNIILPQSELLIKRWTEFFTRSEPNEKFLQLCTSRGAIDVVCALRVLALEQQKRIIVIAIAPASIVPPELCYQVKNCVIPEDPIPSLAFNKELIGTSSAVQVLPNHYPGANAHDLHGSSYGNYIGPLITRYIETNSIF